MSIIFNLTSRVRRAALARAAVICAFAFFVYLNAAPGAFVFDDKPIIVDNPVVKDIRNVGAVFSSAYWGRVVSAGLYRPLTTLSYAINYFLGGLEPLSYHLVNIALHSANSALVYYFLLRLFGAPAQAFMAGLLFAAHPIHSEAVANVVGRAELLALFFSLLAALILIRGLKAHGAKAALHLAVAPAIYLFALFSKESAVGFLPVFFFIRAFASGGVKGGSFLLSRNRLPWVALGHILALAAYLFFRLKALGQNLAPFSLTIPFLDNPLAHLGPAARFVSSAKVLAIYIKGLLWPVRLAADYSYNQIAAASSYFDPPAVFSLLSIAALIALAVSLWPRGKALSFALLFFISTFLPVSNMFFPIGTIMGERLLYMPSLSVSLAFAWAFGFCMQKLRPDHRHGAMRIAPALVLILLLAVFSLRVYERNLDWRDDYTLALNSVRTSPRSAKTNNGFGLALYDAGRIREAMEYYGRAISIYPAYAEAHFNLGIAFSDGRLKDRSTAQYSFALHLRPDYPEALNNIGLSYLELKREGMAEKAWLKATSSARATKEPYNNLGKLYAGKGLEDKAVSLFKSAIALDGSYAEAHFNLANLYARRKDTERAAREYSAALRARPDFLEALNNFGAFQQSVGNRSGAISLYLRAISLRDDHWKSYFNLGTAQLLGGSPDKAIWGLMGTLFHKPDFAHAFYHLAAAFKEKGEIARAESWFSLYRATGKAEPAEAP